MSARRPAADRAGAPPTRQWVENALGEFAASPPATGDAELDAVATAIFVEDVFAISLRDDDITPENLGSPRAVESFVLHRLGLG